MIALIGKRFSKFTDSFYWSSGKYISFSPTSTIISYVSVIVVHNQNESNRYRRFPICFQRLGKLLEILENVQTI